MKHVLVRWLAVIICLGAARAGADESALRLVVTVNGKEFDQFQVQNRKIAAVEGNTVVFVPDDAVWRIEGLSRAQAGNVYLAPDYTLAVVDDPAVQKANAGSPYEADVAVGGGAKGGKGFAPWSNEDLRGGLAAFVWLVDGKPVKVQPVLLPATAEAPHASAKFFLSEKERAGSPVALLYSKNGFVAPAALFKDAAANAALEEMFFGTGETFASAVRKVKNANARNGAGTTLLHLAAGSGLSDAVDRLLAEGAKPGTKEADSDNTALHEAARYGRRADAARLLKAGAGVDAANEGGNTPLFFAILNGHEDVALDLLKADASWSRKNATGQSAGALAFSLGRTGVLRAIPAREHDKLFTPQQLAPALIVQIRRGNAEMVKFILSQKMEPSLSEFGATPLLEAARHGRSEVAEVLLKAGVEADAATRAGTTPLYLAASGGHVGVAEVLLNAGADANRAGVDKMTPLHLAVLNQSTELIKLLVAKGARLDVTDEVGRTPLELALITQNQLAARALADAGARLDVKSKFVNSLIEDAIVLDLVKVVERAVEDGWPVRTLLYDQWPAWRVAELYGAPQTASWLKERSGDLPAPDVVRLGRGIVQPKVENMVLPPDPRDPEKNYGEFRADVDGIVDTKGRFLFARVRNATDLPFKLAVLQVVPAWRFTPALRDNTAVNARIALPLSFPALEERIYQVDELDVKPEVEYMPPLHTATLVSGGQLTNRGWITNASTTDLRTSLKDSVRDGDDVFYATVRFILNKEGKPEDMEIAPGSNVDFGEKIKDALRKARYKPGVYRGEPVRVRMVLTQNMQ